MIAIPKRTAMLPSALRVRPIVGVPTPRDVAHEPPYWVAPVCASAATAATPSAATTERVPTAMVRMAAGIPTQASFITDSVRCPGGGQKAPTPIGVPRPVGPS